jgi:glutamyl-tRNA(Gln) amidotransferase subunit E
MSQTFPPFEEMTPQRWADLGLKVGLEIHQQVLTRRKLFCRCPAGLYRSEYDAEILRHMRPTLSEMGEYDGTALMEKKTRKNIYYRIHHDTVCTYEFDDTPPFFIDDEALDIALEVALLLRLNMVDELHIARKQYLDGSIPTGFQRTTIVGVGGWIPFQDRKIRIRQLGLEEDACREVSDSGHDRIYLTDRLGMPLIETVTEPEMHTPQDAAEVAQVLRRLVRSTGRVRTGYGAGREDVNVSIAGGTRIEIKGVSQIWRIPRLVYNEARRQFSLLRIREELRQRGVTPETFAAEPHDVTRLVHKVRYEPMRQALEKGLLVKCVVLKGFAGILNSDTQEHTSFAKEFSDRVRVIACLTSIPNITHSDTATEALAARDWQQLRRRTKASHEDALVLVWGNEPDTQVACEEIIQRAREATEGIPSDTRQALSDGTNGFERVLPGAQRMYPDTDLPPLRIEADRLERIREQLPPFVWDREARYREMGLAENLVTTLSISPRVSLFERLVDDLGIAPKFAARVVVEHLTTLRREGLPVVGLSDAELIEVFEAFAQGRLAREGVFHVIRAMLSLEAGAAGTTSRVVQAMQQLKIEPVDEAAVKRELKQMATEVEVSAFTSQAQQFRHLMGRLMQKFCGRFDGKRIAALVGAQVGINQLAS